MSVEQLAAKFVFHFTRKGRKAQTPEEKWMREFGMNNWDAGKYK
jgi:hypothetical protein